MALTKVFQRLREDAKDWAEDARGKPFKLMVLDFFRSRLFLAVAISAVLHAAVIAGTSYRTIYTAVTGKELVQRNSEKPAPPGSKENESSTSEIVQSEDPDAVPESERNALRPTGNPDDYVNRELETAKPDEIPKTPEDVNPFDNKGEDLLSE